MPKAKPISLWPLSFDEVLKVLINTPPLAKATKPKKKSKAHRRGLAHGEGLRRTSEAPLSLS